MLNKVKVMGLILLFSGSGLLLILAISIPTQHQRLGRYFNDYDLDYEFISIPVADNLKLAGLHISLKSHSEVSDGSFPVLIHINGANNRKEGRLEYAFNLALLGFEVFVVEPRGHGQSGGHFTLYAEEPRDVMKIIDYISVYYENTNTTHVAVSGFSLGGGMMLLAQAIEPRIYSSVIYHPVTDLGSMMAEYGVDNLFGQNFIADSSYAPNDLEKWEDRSAFKICNASNTQNLLLLQGSEDDDIFVQGSAAFIEYINPDPLTRNDVQLVVREGIGHGGNEENQGSLQYTMAWFSHFFFNNSVDLNTIALEASYQTIVPYTPNIDESYSDNLFFFGIILIQIGLYLVLIAPKLVSNYQKQKELRREIEKKTLGKSGYQRVFFAKSLILLGSAVISGLISKLVDPNIIFGLFYGFIGGSTLGFFVYDYINLYSQKGVSQFEWKADFLYPASIVIIFASSLFVCIAINDWAKNEMLFRVLWPWKGGLLVYPLLVLVFIAWGSAGNTQFGLKQFYYIVGLALVAGFSTYLYLLFNPLPDLEIIRHLSALFIFAISGIWILGFLISYLLKAFSLKTLVGAFYIGLIIAIIALNRFMNLFL